MKTTKSMKPAEVTREWYMLDASTMPLGRLSVIASKLLIGKAKPTYTPHVDGGDYVVVINADKVVVTGKKTDAKRYYRHSGHPGSLKEEKLSHMIDRDSRQVVIKSVRGMLPKNKLRDPRLLRLKVYQDDKHNHEAQKPTAWEEKTSNSKAKEAK